MTFEKRTPSITRLAVLVAALLLVGILPASAENEEHCVVDVVGETLNGELKLSKARCYSQFAEAMVDASNGSLLLPEATRGNVVFTDTEVAARAGSFALGIHYDGYGGSGSSITITGSTCTGGYWNTWSSWDNRISSSYNGCNRLTHWDRPYKRGISQSTYGSGTTDNLSTLNNRAESISYHP